MSTTNPSLVSEEMAAIASFANSTEKRGSTLTLNELNYISDKQLHKKDGGGSGDLSIANVTFINETDDAFTEYFNWPACYEENELGEGAPALIHMHLQVNLLPEESVTAKIPLYKNAIYVEADFSGTEEFIGNIEIMGGGALITGDCTIKFGNGQQNI